MVITVAMMAWVARNFTAAGPDRTWLSDITELPTVEGKLYLSAFKDVYSGRIVGYSMSSRMTAGLPSPRCATPSRCESLRESAGGAGNDDSAASHLSNARHRPPTPPEPLPPSQLKPGQSLRLLHLNEPG